MHLIGYVALAVCAAPALAYTAALLYFFLVDGLSIQAAHVGQFGVVVGLLTFGGWSVARLVWNSCGEQTLLQGRFLALLFVGLIVITGIQRITGDFERSFFGDYRLLFDFGLVLGSVSGLCVTVVIWMSERIAKT